MLHVTTKIIIIFLVRWAIHAFLATLCVHIHVNRCIKYILFWRTLYLWLPNRGNVELAESSCRIAIAFLEISLKKKSAARWSGLEKPKRPGTQWSYLHTVCKQRRQCNCPVVDSNYFSSIVTACECTVYEAWVYFLALQKVQSGIVLCYKLNLHCIITNF